jgi:hypothetical protein
MGPRVIALLLAAGAAPAGAASLNDALVEFAATPEPAAGAPVIAAPDAVAPSAAEPPSASPASSSVAPAADPSAAAEASVDPGAAAPLGKGGRFGKGLSLELPGLGVVQAVGPGGVAVGPALEVALQFDVGARFAIRVPVRLDLAVFGGTKQSYAALALTPELVYRLRAEPAQRWVPYVGAGVKLGLFSAGRATLGLPALGTSGLPLEASGAALFDDHHSSSSSSGASADVETKLAAGLEALVGVEWHPSPWFALNLGLGYGYLRMFGADVHTLREMAGARLTL